MENRLSQNKNVLRYCLECGSEMQGFFLPLYGYEISFVKDARFMIMKVNVIVVKFN